ncbi:MAG: hypothetical protein JW780_08115 [Clostridiales bacterium]|nr:hypothetical protein [Clostridiales bacterium]
MTKCEFCGTEAGNASYCPECGAKIVREAVVPETGSPTDQVSATQESYSAGYQSGGPQDPNYSGESPSQITPNAQQTAGGFQNRPDASGQMVFAIINIVISALLCCCIVGVLSLPFAIVAVVYASGVSKAPSYEEAAQKLKSAKMFNFIALGAVILAIILLVVYVVFVSTAGYEQVISNPYNFENYY